MLKYNPKMKLCFDGCPMAIWRRPLPGAVLNISLSLQKPQCPHHLFGACAGIITVFPRSEFKSTGSIESPFHGPKTQIWTIKVNLCSLPPRYPFQSMRGRSNHVSNLHRWIVPLSLQLNNCILLPSFYIPKTLL